MTIDRDVERYNRLIRCVNRHNRSAERGCGGARYWVDKHADLLLELSELLAEFKVQLRQEGKIK